MNNQNEGIKKLGFQENDPKQSLKEKFYLANHYASSLNEIFEEKPGAIKFNPKQTEEIMTNNTIDFEKLNIGLKDDIYFQIGPFAHKKKIKLRSNYNFYLQYDKNGTPISSFDGSIFEVEACGKTFKLLHSTGYISAGKGVQNFEVTEKEKNKRYTLKAGGKYIGMSIEGRILLYDSSNSIDTFWYVEDQSVDTSAKIGPFYHGSWVILQSITHKAYFRYTTDDQPFTESTHPLPFFIENQPGTKKFRLIYYKGYMVCTVTNGFDFEIFENPNPEKNGYFLKAGEKYLGVSRVTLGIVQLYDSCDQNETKWLCTKFDPSSYSLNNQISHLSKVKLKSYYFRNYYLKTEANKIPIISTQGTTFTCYLVGNMFKFMNEKNLPLCTDQANNNIFIVYVFDPVRENGIAIGTGNPGKLMFIGCGNDGKINLYPSHTYYETRWIPE